MEQFNIKSDLNWILPLGDFRDYLVFFRQHYSQDALKNSLISGVPSKPLKIRGIVKNLTLLLAFYELMVMTIIFLLF